MRCLFLFVALALALSSCAIKPTPVALQCPTLVLPADPKAPVTLLTDKSTPDEVMKAWVATAVAYRNWNQIVRKQADTDRN